MHQCHLFKTNFSKTICTQRTILHKENCNRNDDTTISKKPSKTLLEVITSIVETTEMENFLQRQNVLTHEYK